MKVLAAVVGLGCFQTLVDGVVDLFPAPYAIVRSHTPPTEQRWYCSTCGHSNHDWVSTCGFCGGSKGNRD